MMENRLPGQPKEIGNQHDVLFESKKLLTRREFLKLCAIACLAWFGISSKGLAQEKNKTIHNIAPKTPETIKNFPAVEARPPVQFEGVECTESEVAKRLIGRHGEIISGIDGLLSRNLETYAKEMDIKIPNSFSVNGVLYRAGVRVSELEAKKKELEDAYKKYQEKIKKRLALMEGGKIEGKEEIGLYARITRCSKWLSDNTKKGRELKDGVGIQNRKILLRTWDRHIIGLANQREAIARTEEEILILEREYMGKVPRATVDGLRVSLTSERITQLEIEGMRTEGLKFFESLRRISPKDGKNFLGLNDKSVSDFLAENKDLIPKSGYVTLWRVGSTGESAIRIANAMGANKKLYETSFVSLQNEVKEYMLSDVTSSEVWQFNNWIDKGGKHKDRPKEKKLSKDSEMKFRRWNAWKKRFEARHKRNADNELEKNCFFVLPGGADFEGLPEDRIDYYKKIFAPKNPEFMHRIDYKQIAYGEEYEKLVEAKRKAMIRINLARVNEMHKIIYPLILDYVIKNSFNLTSEDKEILTQPKVDKKKEVEVGNEGHKRKVFFGSVPHKQFVLRKFLENGNNQKILPAEIYRVFVLKYELEETAGIYNAKVEKEADSEEDGGEDDPALVSVDSTSFLKKVKSDSKAGSNFWTQIADLFSGNAAKDDSTGQDTLGENANANVDTSGFNILEEEFSEEGELSEAGNLKNLGEKFDKMNELAEILNPLLKLKRAKGELDNDASDTDKALFRHPLLGKISKKTKKYFDSLWTMGKRQRMVDGELKETDGEIDQVMEYARNLSYVEVSSLHRIPESSLMLMQDFAKFMAKKGFMVYITATDNEDHKGFPHFSGGNVDWLCVKARRSGKAMILTALTPEEEIEVMYLQQAFFSQYHYIQRDSSGNYSYANQIDKFKLNLFNLFAIFEPLQGGSGKSEGKHDHVDTRGEALGFFRDRIFEMYKKWLEKNGYKNESEKLAKEDIVRTPYLYYKFISAMPLHRLKSTLQGNIAEKFRREEIELMKKQKEVKMKLRKKLKKLHPQDSTENIEKTKEKLVSIVEQLVKQKDKTLKVITTELRNQLKTIYLGKSAEVIGDITEILLLIKGLENQKIKMEPKFNEHLNFLDQLLPL